MAQSHLHLDQLRLRQLRLLDLIDRLGSLRAVAGEINLTQPAVSQMLKDFERAFGVELVQRSARGVALTRAGRVALDRASSALATFDNLAADLAAEPAPVLRIATNPAILLSLFPAALRELDVPRSDIRFRLQIGTVGAMMELLWAGAVDCYVGRVSWPDISDSRANRLTATPISQTEFVVVCSKQHPLASRETVSAAELVEWPWALQPASFSIRSTIETAFRDCGVAMPPPVVEIDADPTTVTMLARWVDLLICVPRAGLESQIETGAMHLLPLSDLRLPPIQTYFLSLHENRDLPPLGKLREALLVAAAQG